MSGVASAIAGAGILGAGASLAGSKKQAGAAKDAAALQMQQFELLNKQQQPFIKSGYAANARLSELLGLGGGTTAGGNMYASPAAQPLSFEEWGDQNMVRDPGMPQALRPGARNVMIPNPDQGAYQQYVQQFMGSQGGAGAPAGDGTQSADFGSLLKPFTAQEFNQYQDPGYQFRKKQGEQSVLNSAAAGSGSMSGAALKDLLSFNQDLASTEYGNAFNRYQTQQGNIFQRLAGLTQMGQSAAAGVGQQGTALAGNAGQALQNAGTASGAGIVGAGNALSGAASNYWLSSLLQNQPAAVGVP